MAKLRPNQFTLPSGAVITEIPLLHSTEMVRANLEGRKNETRRTKGLSLNSVGRPKEDWTYTECYLGSDTKGNDAWMAEVKHIPTGGTHADISPYGKPGDLLWVRETFVETIDSRFFFKADEDELSLKQNWGWKPSIHMPKDASRLWLMVEEIRVERVQDITEESAIAEGIIRVERAGGPGYGTSVEWNYLRPNHEKTSTEAFMALWISINGKASWDSNPWVWVVKYRVLSKTGRPSMDVIEKNYLEVTGKEAPSV